VSLAPLTGLRFLDDAELQQFVDLRADDCLLLSRMVSRGEAVARHLPLRSIDFDDHWVDLCRQGPDRCREDVNIFSAKAPQLFLEPWRPGEFNHGNDLIWRLGVRTVGTHFEWICLPIDVIIVRDIDFINEGRLINRCEVCKLMTVL
jgi:hypothetical protein